MTTQDRYRVAVEYVKSAVEIVERGPQVFDPLSAGIEWYGGRLKTEPYRNELGRIEHRWLRATNDIDRARVARDAELLADWTEETLPGAPQDRPRTNLGKGETPSSTPATSYADELDRQAASAWGWVDNVAHRSVGHKIALERCLFSGQRPFSCYSVCKW